MRPTGKLHLGHLVGALENWVALQKDFQNYHLIADYHALTTNPDTSGLYDNSIQMLIDWLAAGIDPKQSPVFRQSQIKEHTELFLMFCMLITTSRLERNPTLKEQVRDLKIEHSDAIAAPFVTLSVGGAVAVPRVDDGVINLIGIADRNMYQAKARGRNQFVFHE